MSGAPEKLDFPAHPWYNAHMIDRYRCIQTADRRGLDRRRDELEHWTAAIF